MLSALVQASSDGRSAILTPFSSAQTKMMLEKREKSKERVSLNSAGTRAKLGVFFLKRTVGGGVGKKARVARSTGWLLRSLAVVTRRFSCYVITPTGVSHAASCRDFSLDKP